MRNRKQTRIDFESEIKSIPPTYYPNLNINQKINVKANSMGFPGNYINPRFTLVTVITRWNHPECLHKRYFTHIQPISMKTIMSQQKLFNEHSK